MNYFMKTETDSTPVAVCKVFFLSTLGFKPTNDCFVHQALKGVSSGSITPKSDGRGKTPAKNKIEREIIRTHIESFHPCISHYRREHAPNMRYLPSDISIKSMYDDFKLRHGRTCSYDLYRMVVKEMRISFTKLGHEECEICESFNFHDRNHKKENLDAACEMCKKWKLHIEKANASRCEYQKDKNAQNPNMPVFSADLQKVIMLPRMDTFKSVVFTKRIIAFNETFAPLGSTNVNQPVAVLWHEAIADRRKEDIISAFHAFLLMNRDHDEITLWLDNCTAQNKNWAFFTFLVYIVNSSEVSTNVIHLKYFEPGHTYMSADAFHHQVEKSMRTAGKVYDFSDFVKCVQSANSGKAMVKTMEPIDFCEWPDHSSQYKLTHTSPRPYLGSMVSVRAVRGNRGLLYRTDFGTPEIELNFLTARTAKFGVQKAVCRSGPRGIPQQKKDDILTKLCNLMPPSRHAFWQNLPTSNAPDLLCDE